MKINKFITNINLYIFNYSNNNSLKVIIIIVLMSFIKPPKINLKIHVFKRKKKKLKISGFNKKSSKSIQISHFENPQ